MLADAEAAALSKAEGTGVSIADDDEEEGDDEDETTFDANRTHPLSKSVSGVAPESSDGKSGKKMSRRQRRRSSIVQAALGEGSVSLDAAVDDPSAAVDS